MGKKLKGSMALSNRIADQGIKIHVQKCTINVLQLI